MDQLTVVEFLEQNKEFLFPNKRYTEFEVENTLMKAPDLFEMSMKSIPFRNPRIVQIISVFPGSLGVDRFYLGDIAKAILKYFTLGGLGIWWIADIISAKDRCRTYNCKKLMEAVNDPLVISQMQNTDDLINKTVENVKKFTPVAKELFNGAKDVAKTFDIDN